MNAISYINGDAQVTDFPATSARPLASFVQLCNDSLAEADGYLSPENAFLVLDLGWLTVGTADVADTVIHTWVTKLLISPTYRHRNPRPCRRTAGRNDQPSAGRSAETSHPGVAP